MPAETHAAPLCHVVVPTHTTRHLEPCLVSLARQSHPPDSIVVTCDTDDAVIATLLDETRRALGPRLPRLIHVSRPHTGVARLNQVRNNGLRALDSVVAPAAGDLIVVLDGDTMLAPDTIGRHLDAARRGADVIIPYRVNLDEKTTDRVVRSTLDLPDLRDLVTEADTRLLVHRHRRYQRQLLLRRLFPAWLGVVKAHKPKVLGGHHAVRASVMRRVNGYDEQYVGYGYDDDDLTRRLYQLRPRVSVSIAVKESLSFHLWHPTRAPQRPTQAPGYARFVRTDLPTHAEAGWASPGDQPDVRVREVV